MYDENKHTKLVEVPQSRVWRETDQGRWAYTWEDGYHARAYIHAVGTIDVDPCSVHWYTSAGRLSGWADTLEDAKRQAEAAMGVKAARSI